jgi:hypothetical protein
MRSFEGGNRLLEVPDRDIRVPQDGVRRELALVEVDRIPSGGCQGRAR